ncbi:hypothetical protein AL573_00440 [Rickettsia amblyommatis]|nr:hypothetical protein AL573_00440 [Rickettsia amblyommatis]
MRGFKKFLIWKSQLIEQRIIGNDTVLVRNGFNNVWMGQKTRNKLTDYWKNHEVTKENEFAILTNIIHQEWAGITC